MADAEKNQLYVDNADEVSTLSSPFRRWWIAAAGIAGVVLVAVVAVVALQKSTPQWIPGMPPVGMCYQHNFPFDQGFLTATLTLGIGGFPGYTQYIWDQVIADHIVFDAFNDIVEAMAPANVHCNFTNGITLSQWIGPSEDQVCHGGWGFADMFSDEAGTCYAAPGGFFPVYEVKWNDLTPQQMGVVSLTPIGGGTMELLNLTATGAETDNNARVPVAAFVDALAYTNMMYCDLGNLNVIHDDGLIPPTFQLSNWDLTMIGAPVKNLLIPGIPDTHLFYDDTNPIDEAFAFFDAKLGATQHTSVWIDHDMGLGQWQVNSSANAWVGPALDICCDGNLETLGEDPVRVHRWYHVTK